MPETFLLKNTHGSDELEHNKLHNNKVAKRKSVNVLDCSKQ